MQTNALRFLTRLVLACVLTLPLTASAEPHEHFREGGGRAFIVPHYSYVYPYWGPGWGWGWDWGWGGPFWDNAPRYHRSTGQVKIKDHNKMDEVYVNGAYAGTVAKMKNINLAPGTYTLQIKRDGKELLNRSLYVIAGKTLDINVEGG